MALTSTYRRLLYVVIGIALFLVLLPEVIRLGARYAFMEFSAQAAEIEDVDLNLFTGRVGITGVRIDYADETTLTLGEFRVDIDMAALFSKHLLVEQLQLSEVSARIYENAGQWVAVLPIPESEAAASGVEEDSGGEDSSEEGSSWKVGVNALSLDNVDLHARYQGQNHQLTLSQVVASDLFMWQPDTQASLMLKGALNGAPLNFESGLKPFADPQAFSLDIVLSGLDLDPVNQFLPDTVEGIDASLDIDTNVAVQLQASGDIILTQDGTVTLTLNKARAAGVAAAIDQVRWQGNVDVNVPQDSGISVAAVGEASVKGLQASYSQLEADSSLKSLVWNGDVETRLPKEAQPVLAMKGQLTLEDLVAGQKTLALTQQLAGLQWKGNVEMDLAALADSLNIQGEMNLKSWQIEDKSQSGRLVAMDSLSLNGVAVKGFNDVALSTADLKGLSAMTVLVGKADEAPSDTQATDSLVSLGSLSIANAELAGQNSLMVATVELTDLQGELTKSPEGKLVILDDWVADLQSRSDSFQSKLAEQQNSGSDSGEEAVAAAENEQEQETTATETGKSENTQTPFRFGVEQITVIGENRFTFNDQSMEPDVTHPVQLKTLQMGRIDSGSAAELTPITVEMALYEYGYLKVSGEATPLQSLDALQANVKAEVKGIELPELSPYIESTIGYHANSGQLNLDSKASIKAGKLDSKTDLKVLRMDLKPVDQALIEKLGKKLTMPVDTALSIITDSDNTLSLTIPVKGDLAKPDIHLDRIIGGAVAQAVQNAAFTYFKYAVQPFGAIMMVSEKIGDMTLQAKFEPARFVAGTARIVPEQSGYLEKVAGMIKEKKDFSVLVCVMVTDQDFQARETPPTLEEGQSYQWDEASEALAKARLDTIKTSLIKEHGLSPDRVQTCRPQLGKGEPRAIMGI